MDVLLRSIPGSPTIEVDINLDATEVGVGNQQEWIFVAPNGQQKYKMRSNLNVSEEGMNKVIIFGDAMKYIRDRNMSQLFEQQNVSIPAASWKIPDDVLQEDAPKILSIPFGYPIGDILNLIEKISPDAIISCGEVPLPIGMNLKSVLEEHGFEIPCFCKSASSYGINDNIIEAVASYLTDAFKRPNAESTESVIIEKVIHASGCPFGSRLGDRDNVEFQAPCGRETKVKVLPRGGVSHIKVNGVNYEIPEREISEDHAKLMDALDLLKNPSDAIDEVVLDAIHACRGKKRTATASFGDRKMLPPLLRAKSGFHEQDQDVYI